MSTLTAQQLSELSAIGDRLKLLKKLLDFIRSLDLDLGQIIALIKEAVDLFQGGFSLDKLLAFIEKLLAIFNSAPTPTTPTAASLFGGDLKEFFEELVALVNVLKILLGA